MCMTNSPFVAAGEIAGFDGLAAVREATREIAGHRNAIDGRIVDVAVWLLGTDEWRGTGLYKPEQFLAFRFGIGLAAARRYVDVARRVGELPASVDALRAGELSLDQLMPIVRRVPAWADEQVLVLSKMLTVGQINAVINKYDFERSGLPEQRTPTDEPDSGDAPPQTDPIPDRSTTPNATTPTPAADSSRPIEAKDRCWMGVDDDGRFRLHLETSAELGASISNAVDEARDRIFRDTGNRITDAQALADVADRSLAMIEDRGRIERFRTNIHLNTDGRATDHLGTPLPPVVVEHITCDGLLTPVFHKDGLPISVGRIQHIVPTRTRKIVLLRDGGCAVPGCGATRHLDIHHITHWSNGGSSDTPNLIALCGHHHRMHHHGRLDITGDADAASVVFRNEHGTNLANDGPRPTPPSGPPPEPAGDYAPPLCERLDMNYVCFIHPERLHPKSRHAQAWAKRQANR